MIHIIKHQQLAKTFRFKFFSLTIPPLGCTLKSMVHRMRFGSAVQKWSESAVQQRICSYFSPRRGMAGMEDTFFFHPVVCCRHLLFAFHQQSCREILFLFECSLEKICPPIHQGTTEKKQNNDKLKKQVQLNIQLITQNKGLTSDSIKLCDHQIQLQPVKTISNSRTKHRCRYVLVYTCKVILMQPFFHIKQLTTHII